MATASPFPGMDPYLERHWLDIHTRLATYSADALNGVLPDDLVARAEERLVVGADDGSGGRDKSGYYPDARVFQVAESFDPADTTAGTAATNGGGAAVAIAPLKLSPLDEPITERSVRILDADGNRIVTAIELVSPWNKRGRGVTEHQRKRRKFLAGGTNVVEIDLVRAGNWRRLLRPAAAPESAATAYRATMWVASGSGRFEHDIYLHPIRLDEPLPTINVPLRTGEAPARLDLQGLIVQAYRNGKYARTLDYRRECEPPLRGPTAEWADETLRAAGRR